jgi:tetratricopeptide (TPR) repeat protein
VKCPNHLMRNAAGYCCVCGSFYCEDCLTRHDGNLYCPRHYKPIAAKMEEDQRRAESRKRHSRHALVVQFKNGQREQGVCHAMNIRESGFHLTCEDDNGVASGKTARVRFSDVKYVANVKSYTGKFDKSQSYQGYTPGGSDLIVEFEDGEMIEGTTVHSYDPDAPRFYLIPKDPNSNFITVLIESASVTCTYTPAEWAAKKAAHEEKKRQLKAEGQQAGATPTSQEETMGDFYFEQHNYTGALEQYRIAFRRSPESLRLKKKLLASTINVGIGFIKRRDYPKALEWMEKALEIDPENDAAKRKTKQLRRVIEKTQRAMQAYREGTLFKKTAAAEDDDDPFDD